MAKWTVKDEHGRDVVEISADEQSDKVTINLAGRAEGSGTVLLGVKALQDLRLKVSMAINIAQSDPNEPKPERQPIDPERLAAAMAEHGLRYVVDDDGVHVLGRDGRVDDEDDET